MDPTDILSQTTFTRTKLFDMLNGMEFPSFKYCQEQMKNSQEDKSYYYGLTRYNNEKQIYDDKYSKIENLCQVGGLLIGQNITLTLKGRRLYGKNIKGKVESVNEKKQSITLGREYSDFESVTFDKSLDEMDKLLIVNSKDLIKKLDSYKISILIGRGIVFLEEMLSQVKSFGYGEEMISVEIGVPITVNIGIRSGKEIDVAREIRKNELRIKRGEQPIKIEKFYKRITGYNSKKLEITIESSLIALLNDQKSLNKLYGGTFSHVPLRKLNSIRESITGIKAKFAKDERFTAIVNAFSQEFTDIEEKMMALIEKHNPTLENARTYGIPGGRLFTRKNSKKNTKKNRKIRRNKTSSKIN